MDVAPFLEANKERVEEVPATLKDVGEPAMLKGVDVAAVLRDVVVPATLKDVGAPAEWRIKMRVYVEVWRLRLGGESKKG